MLSHLTRRRALLGIGVAHLPPDVRLYGVPRARRLERLVELLGVVQAASRGEPLKAHGYPREATAALPYRGEAPEVWIGTHGPRGLKVAGQGENVRLADPQRHVNVIGRLPQEYRDHAHDARRTPRWRCCSATAGSESRVLSVTHVAPARHGGASPVQQRGQLAASVPALDGFVRSRAHLTAELVAPVRFLYGGGEEIRAELAEWSQITGAQVVALRTRQPGGPTQESTLGAISRFGRELIEPLTTSKASQSAEHREHDCGVA